MVFPDAAFDLFGDTALHKAEFRQLYRVSQHLDIRTHTEKVLKGCVQVSQRGLQSSRIHFP